MARARGRPAGPAVLAGWKLRDEARGPAATHWTRPGGGVAPPRTLPAALPRGMGFPADMPEQRPLSWSSSSAVSPLLPGPAARRTSSLPSLGASHDLEKEGRAGRGNDFYTPDSAPRLDGINDWEPHFRRLKWGLQWHLLTGSCTG